MFSAALSGGGGATRLGRSEETNGRRTCQISLLVGGSDCVWGMWDQFGGKGGGGISRCCKAYHTYTQKRRLTAKIDPAASRRWQRPLSLNVRLLTKQILVDAKSQDEGTVSSRRRGTPTLRLSRGSDTLQLSRGFQYPTNIAGFQYPTNIAGFQLPTNIAGFQYPTDIAGLQA